LEHEHVLLIDDDADSRHLYRRAMEWAGLQVETAATGIAGVRAARVRPPSAVLVDLLMPGLNGVGVLEQLRRDALTQSIPVIAITGVPEWLQDFPTTHSFDAVLVKPVDVQELVGTIRHLIDQVKGSQPRA
jgi:DNA-binding response OmpR family regulator